MTVRHQAATDKIDDDICLTNVDQHIILEHDRVLLADKDTVAHAKILDQVQTLITIVLNLEVTTSVLLRSLRVLVRDDKVVDNFFLCQEIKEKINNDLN